jgi:hypothetical protein
MNEIEALALLVGYGIAGLYFFIFARVLWNLGSMLTRISKIK